jgi:acetamidase/formamidase
MESIPGDVDGGAGRHGSLLPAIPPIETIGNGDTVEFDLLDASNGKLTETTTVDQTTGLRMLNALCPSRR